MRNVLSVIAAAAVSTLALRGQNPSPSMVIQGQDAQNGRTVNFGGRGRWLAMRTDQAMIRILSSTDGTLMNTISDPEGSRIGLLAADPVRDRVALASSDVTVYFLDIVSGKQVWRSTPPAIPKDHVATVTGLHFSPDGSRFEAFISVTARARFRIPQPEVTLYAWDSTSGAVLSQRKLPAPASSFSTDGRWLLSSGFSGRRFTSAVLDASTLAPVGPEIQGQILAAHAGAGSAIVILHDNNAVPTGSRLINVATGQTIATLPYGLGGAFSPDGSTFVMLGMGFGWQVFEAATGRVRFTGGGSLPMPLSGSISFSIDGTQFAALQISPMLISAADPSQYRLFTASQTPLIKAEAMGPNGTFENRATMELESRSQTFLAPFAAGAAASFTGDGRWLITRSADGQLDFFDAATGNKMPYRVPTVPGSKESLATSSNGRNVYVKSAIRNEQHTVQTKVARRPVSYQLTSRASSTETVDTVSGRVTKKTDFHNIRCITPSGEFAVELTRTNDVQSASLRSAAHDSHPEFPESVNFTAGCSISSDGKYIVVAGGKPAKRATALSRDDSDDFFGGRWGELKSELEVYDIAAQRTVTVLQDEQSKTGKFPFPATTLRWTPDNRYLVGGGQTDNMGGFTRRGPVRIWEVSSGKLLRTIPSSDGFVIVGIAPDLSLLLTATPRGKVLSQSFGVDVRDGTSGAIRYTLPDALAAPEALVLSPNGSVIVGPDREGVLSLWNRADGARIGQLRSLQEGEWLVTSADGLFDGTPRAWSLISWHDAGHTLQTAPGEIYFNEFYRPGLLSDLLEGRRPPIARAISSIDRRQPKISLGATTQDRAVRIRLTATEAPPDQTRPNGSGLRDLRLFRNGILVKAWRGDLPLDRSGSITVEATLPAPAGENRFSAYAFNAENVRSAEATENATVPGTPVPGKAYVLAIGVNEYANAEFNLRYAVPDAEALAVQLAERQKSLGQFAAIRTITLKDREATGANIRFALARLSGAKSQPPAAGFPTSLAEIEPVGPEDTLILYFAGHGIASGDRFYLIPHDLGYAGPRLQTRANLAAILQHGISDVDLEAALEPVMARHIVLVIDACQSGQALASDDDRRGPMNSRGLAQLAWEKGMSVLAASEAYQAALESSRIGHGFLTFALTEEALKTPVADAAPVDGVITEAEWLQYAVRRVPQLQIEELEKAKSENRILTLEVAPGNNTGGSRLQSPRLFTRRDLAGDVLRVAKF